MAKYLKNCEIQVFVTRLDYDLPKKEFNTLIKHLSINRRKKILKYIFYEDALRSLFSELLIRYVISNIKNDNWINIIFTKNEYGKPSFVNIKDIHFNLSHSGPWVVCAVSLKPVGIDIEQIKPIDLKIAKRFFSKKEYEDILNKNDEEKLAYFYDLWTLKESYIKYKGKGLSIPLHSFSIQKNREEFTLFIENRKYKKIFFKQYYIDSKFKLSVCGESNIFAKNVCYFELNEIYSKFK